MKKPLEFKVEEFYPHDKSKKERKWVQNFRQIISIDPARLNLAIRIERRYHTYNTISMTDKADRVETLIFHRASLKDFSNCEPIAIKELFDKIYKYIPTTHMVIIERQPKKNFGIERIASQIIFYLCELLRNQILLPSIYEIDARIKSRLLGFGKKVKDDSEIFANNLFRKRKDNFAISILDSEQKKQDDLCDTVSQIEAFLKYKNYLIN